MCEREAEQQELRIFGGNGHREERLLRLMLDAMYEVSCVFDQPGEEYQQDQREFA